MRLDDLLVRLVRSVRRRAPGVRVVSVATVGVLVAALTSLVVLPAHASQAPPDAHVSIEHISYVPQDITVPVNTKVVWTNNETDQTTHSVTGGPLASPDLTPGLSYAYTFTGPGTFTYHCRFHSYMQGTVTVTDPSSSSTTSTTAASTSTTAPTSSTTVTTAPTPSSTDNGSEYVGAALGDGTFLAKYDVVGGVKVFHLVMSQIPWSPTKGQNVQGFAFDGLIPGPVIRVNEGDRVRMIVQNRLPAGEMTGVHWHGMVLPNDQDGVPGLTQDPIQPGQDYTYEWTAVSTGTHWYHAHMGGAQIGKGLYGPLQVVPKVNTIVADHDYSLMFSDTNLGFTLNGKKFPDTTPLHAKVGEKVHIRIYDAGDDEHAIHLHGTEFQVVAQDGNMLASPYYADTINISPGQTFDIIAIEKYPGKWALHCHKFIHSETMDGMNGMTTVLDVSP